MRPSVAGGRTGNGSESARMKELRETWGHRPVELPVHPCLRPCDLGAGSGQHRGPEAVFSDDGLREDFGGDSPRSGPPGSGPAGRHGERFGNRQVPDREP